MDADDEKSEIVELYEENNTKYYKKTLLFRDDIKISAIYFSTTKLLVYETYYGKRLAYRCVHPVDDYSQFGFLTQ